MRSACHGECSKNRFIKAPDGEDGVNDLCAAYKAFFTHIDGSIKNMQISAAEKEALLSAATNP